MHYTNNRVLCHIIFGQEQDFQDELNRAPATEML